MDNKADYGWALALILFTLWFGNFGAEQERTTVHLLECDQFSEKGSCLRSHPGPIAEFRAIAVSQQVIELADAHIWQVTGCSVFDRKNWRCSEASMDDGELTQTWKSPTAGSLQVGKLMWYFKYALWWPSKPPSGSKSSTN